MATGARPFLKALEGLRAYAFLMVFLVHFSGSRLSLQGRSIASYPWLLVLQLSFVAVPIFFALSGYLITGILFDTLERGGYFRVFYLRRAIRVLPLYYFILLLSGTIALVGGFHFHPGHMLYLVYLHNWNPDATLPFWGRYVNVQHLWSMAVEEQFYLVWPVVVFLLRGRRQLLVFCYLMVGVTFLLRFACPLWHISIFQAYVSTFLRCDTIMLGSALALHQRGPMQSLERLTKPAAVIAVGGLLAMAGRALIVGQALPLDWFGVAFVMPTISLVGASLMVLAIHPGNLVHSLSEQGWAVAMGKLSYSMYVLHELLLPLWELHVIPFCSRVAGHGTGRVIALSLALAIIYGASRLTYRLLEMPGLQLKDRIRYGARHLAPENEQGKDIPLSNSTAIMS